MTERRGFLSRVFGGEDVGEGETRIYSAEEVGVERHHEEEVEQHPHGFTVERAAEIIADLPPDVSRKSAVRIVKGTLVAAGIRFEDLERSTRVRETRLESEIELAEGRQEELKERTSEVVRSLEEDIRRACEARDNGLAEEEEKILRSRKGLEDISKVRAFFGFPGGEESADEPSGAEGTTTTGHEQTPAADEVGDETQILEPYDDADETQVIRRSRPLAQGPLAQDRDDEATEER